MYAGWHVTAIVPALNEAQAITPVVNEIRKQTVGGRRLFDRVVVCDNGSSDETALLARTAGATVVYESKHKGYGAACLRAIAAAGDTDWFVFIDADGSVPIHKSQELLACGGTGADLIIGARERSSATQYMSSPQRFGNWLATTLIALLWQYHYRDLGPFRAISRAALERLDMQDRRFGWTVEMQIKAIESNLCIAEVEVETFDRIAGHSKISGSVMGVIKAGYGILYTIAKYFIKGVFRRAGQRNNTMMPYPIDCSALALKGTPEKSPKA